MLAPAWTAAAADDSAFQQAMQLHLGAEPLTVGSVRIYAKESITRMYAANQYRPLWTPEAALALAAALDEVEAEGLSPSDYRFAERDPSVKVTDPRQLSAAAAADREILLSEALARALYNLHFGKVDAESLDANINFTRPLGGPEGSDLAGEMAAAITQGRIRETLAGASPQNPVHQRLRQALALYRRYQAAGGWAPVPAGKTLQRGDRGDAVVALRKRLATTGDITGADSAEPALFNDVVADGVSSFQQRHGLDADGRAGPATIAAMNVPVQQRIDQIRVNLERQRWFLHEAHDQFLVVDIAGFTAYWIRDGEAIWQDQIQVGTGFTQTPIFLGLVRYLELNPTWTIPPGIVTRTVLPALRKDPGYLGKKGYELLTRDGKPVDPKSVAWKTIKGFPYVVRQPAGADNALGRVKFMFPNPHFVFLHDTNHRELFDRTQRTFSSGCIRVRDPLRLATLMLAANKDWDRSRIDAVVASGKTTRVDLATPLRILIAYQTARADGDRVYFRADIYKRDAALLTVLDGGFRVRRQDLVNGR